MTFPGAATSGPSGQFLFCSLGAEGLGFLGVLDVKGSSVAAAVEAESGSTFPPAVPSSPPESLFGDDGDDWDDLFGHKLVGDHEAKDAVNAAKSSTASPPRVLAPPPPAPVALFLPTAPTLPAPSSVPALPPSPAGLPSPALRAPARESTPPTPVPYQIQGGLKLPAVGPSRAQQPVHPPASAARTAPARPAARPAPRPAPSASAPRPTPPAVCPSPARQPVLPPAPADNAQAGPAPQSSLSAGARPSPPSGLPFASGFIWNWAPVPTTPAAPRSLAERWLARHEPLSLAVFGTGPAAPVSPPQQPRARETIASMLAARVQKPTFPDIRDPRCWPPRREVDYFQRAPAPTQPAGPARVASRAARPPVVPPARSSSSAPPTPGKHRPIPRLPAALLALAGKSKRVKKPKRKPTPLLKKAILRSAKQATLRRRAAQKAATVPGPSTLPAMAPAPTPRTTTTVPALPTVAATKSQGQAAPVAANRAALLRRLAALRAKRAAILARAAEEFQAAQRRKIKRERRDEETSPAAVAERRKRMTPRERFDDQMERAVKQWRTLEAVRSGEVKPVLVEDDYEEEKQGGKEDVEMVDAPPARDCGADVGRTQTQSREVEMVVLDD